MTRDIEEVGSQRGDIVLIPRSADCWNHGAEDAPRWGMGMYAWPGEESLLSHDNPGLNAMRFVW